MKKIDFKKLLPHLLAIVIFLILTLAYFSPAAFEGKDLPQSDVTSSQGWGKDLKDYHAKTGDYAFWTNSMFGGMPANYAYAPKHINIFSTISVILSLNLKLLHLGLFFIALIGFYILLLSLKCKPWIGIVGAIAYAFASFNIISIEAGHVNKCLAMATMAPTLGGIILIYRKKYLLGTFTTLIFTGLNLYYNHQQITYYLGIMGLVLAFVYFIYAIKEKSIKDFFKSSAIILVVVCIAALPSLGKMITTMDYAKETMRGGAVLQHNAQGEKESAGLEIDYAFRWSYGIGETWTMLIPNFYGSSSHYNIGSNSNCYKALSSTGQAKSFCKYAPTYWGAQPFTSGPVYVGAIICFLFVLGLFIVRGREKWWLLATTLISIMLAWGANFATVNNFLFYNLPLYSKFRAPSMALSIAGVAMVVLAMLALKQLIEELQNDNRKQWALKKVFISSGIVGGFALIFALFGSGLYNFSAISDTNYPDWLVSALEADRKSMLSSDAWRSFAFIALAFVTIWSYIKFKFKTNILVIILGSLIIIDLWVIDKRFINKDNFVPAKKAKAILPTEVDNYILQDKDPNYRVLNLTTSTFNESNTSFFHKSIGGYSPAKLRRYQDIIDFHLSSKINMNVLNMLNTKYVIVRNNETGAISPQRNIDALGNVWFVDTIKWVNSPDEEITALNDFNPSTTAIIDKTWKENVKYIDTIITNSNSIYSIKLTDYNNPGYLIYHSDNPNAQLAVFSEVFYKTWKAYIDGQEVPILRVNYILRGLEIPAGSHKIEFKCIDSLYIKSMSISKWGSYFVGLVLLVLIALIIKQQFMKKED